MSTLLPGKHHNTRIAAQTADALADALRQRCEANGGSLGFEDIETVVSVFKTSGRMQQDSEQIFSPCRTTTKNDRTHLHEITDYAAFALFHTFGASTRKAFTSQISSAPMKWPTEFSKALVGVGKSVFEIDLESVTQAAYMHASVNKGALLCFDDVLSAPDVMAAVAALRTALTMTARSTEAKRLFCESLNEKLGQAFNVRQPHELLLNESSVAVFLEDIEKHEVAFV